jgi:hypothetical protein
MSDKRALKKETDDVVSAVGKAMSKAKGDWAAAAMALAQTKPQVEAVIERIKDSEGRGKISRAEAQELQNSLLERLKQYGISLG